MGVIPPPTTPTFTGSIADTQIAVGDGTDSLGGSADLVSTGSSLEVRSSDFDVYGEDDAILFQCDIDKDKVNLTDGSNEAAGSVTPVLRIVRSRDPDIDESQYTGAISLVNNESDGTARDVMKVFAQVTDTDPDDFTSKIYFRGYNAWDGTDTQNADWFQCVLSKGKPKVGINCHPAYTLHIANAQASGQTSGDTYICIDNTDAEEDEYTGLLFGDLSSNNIGKLQYDHDSERIMLACNDATKVIFDDDKNLFYQSVEISSSPSAPATKLDVKGEARFLRKVHEKDDDYTVTAAECYGDHFTTTVASKTLTLPTAVAGMHLSVSTIAQPVTLDGNSSEPINGSANVGFAINNAIAHLVCFRTGYWQASLGVPLA